ncbi:MAG: hypothetical protein MZV70_41620 [Desulfobacterales bacterium]|nr:hypothetical protein [Desulfobacterales bacterium]
MGDGGSDYECDQANNVRMSVVSSAVTRLARWVVAALVLLAPLGQALAAPCDVKSSAPPFIDHDLSVSYCELCGYGYVTVIVANPYSGATMTNLRIVEDLGTSGLTYAGTAPNPVRYRINGGPLQVGPAPGISGANGSVLTFNLAGISLDSSPGAGNDGDTIALTFAVARATALTDEGLVIANRTITATVSFNTDSGCAGSPQSATDLLPLREPRPSVTKTGWNYDAGQRQGTAASTVYGNNNDDVVWRIRVANNGLADLQDLRFDDLMQAGNLVINFACPTQATADAVAANNGVRPGGLAVRGRHKHHQRFRRRQPVRQPVQRLARPGGRAGRQQRIDLPGGQDHGQRVLRDQQDQHRVRRPVGLPGGSPGRGYNRHLDGRHARQRHGAALHPVRRRRGRRCRSSASLPAPTRRSRSEPRAR